MLGSNLINDRRLDSLPFRFLFSSIISSILLTLLFATGCRRESWSPDAQYALEIDRLQKISTVRNSEIQEKAHKNVLNEKATLYQKLDTDDKLKRWILQNRFRMSLIASTSHDGLSWEKRSLKFSDVVEFYHGPQSQEHIIAKDKDFNISFICNFDQITSFERF